MSVLLLRLAGPLQAWGSAARFARRTTENAPTKSGVLGLLAAAQGRDRDADLSDLAVLRFGVRIDQPGTRLRDYQTAQHADTGQSMPLTERYYLADAVFVAAVEGTAELIEALYTAIRAPVYLPYLGRRSCPPAAPIDLAMRTDVDLVQALSQEAWQATERHKELLRDTSSDVELDLLIECSPGEEAHLSLRDTPLSFDPRHRQYALRDIRTTSVRVPAKPPAHDPMSHLGIV